MQLEFVKCKKINVETPPISIPKNDQQLMFLFPTVPEPHRGRIEFKIFKKESIFEPATRIAHGLRHGSVISCRVVAGPGRYLGNFRYDLGEGNYAEKFDALR